MTKLEKSNCDKTQKLKLWPNSKKFKLWQNPKTHIVTVVQVTVVVTVAVVTVVIMTAFSKNNLTPRQPMRSSQGSFSRFSPFFL